MPKAQETKAVSVTVEGHLRKSRDEPRIFGAAEELFASYLEERECYGNFVLVALDAQNGSPELAGRIRIKGRDAGMHLIRVLMQPSSKTDTCWLYGLRVPHGFDTEELFQILSAEKPELEPPQPVSEAHLQNQPEVVQLTGGPDPSESASSDKISPTAFVEDLNLVSLACKELFPKPESTACVSDAREILMEEMKWTAQQATQALQALENRGHLVRRSINGSPHYELASDALKAAFVTWGVHKPKQVAVPEPKVAPPPNEEYKIGMRLPPADNVRILRPPKTPTGKTAPTQKSVQTSALPPPPTNVPVTVSPTAPDAGISNNLAVLEQMAADHERARREFIDSSGPKTALEERRTRLKQELEEIELSLSRIDERRTAAMATITSEVHMHAASKVAQIRAILEG